MKKSGRKRKRKPERKVEKPTSKCTCILWDQRGTRDHP